MPYKNSADKNKAQKLRYERYKENSPFKHKCQRAKSRSQYLKVPFDLTADYLESIWTGICPVLKSRISLVGERTDEYVAELDRYIPSKGYVQGNVQFMSRRANRLKGNFEIHELENLLDWMKSHEDR